MYVDSTLLVLSRKVITKEFCCSCISYICKVCRLRILLICNERFARREWDSERSVGMVEVRLSPLWHWCSAGGWTPHSWPGCEWCKGEWWNLPSATLHNPSTTHWPPHSPPLARPSQDLLICCTCHFDINTRSPSPPWLSNWLFSNAFWHTCYGCTIVILRDWRMFHLPRHWGFGR